VLKASIDLVQQRWGKLDRRKHSTTSIHIYEIRLRVDKHGFDLSSDALRYSPLWYRGSNAIGDAVRYAKSYSQSHPVVIRVYDATGNLIETHEQTLARQPRCPQFPRMSALQDASHVSPTATTVPVLRAVTPKSLFPPLPGLGLLMILQRVPSQCSLSV
jgi:hypothetical protein